MFRNSLLLKCVNLGPGAEDMGGSCFVTARHRGAYSVEYNAILRYNLTKEIQFISLVLRYLNWKSSTRC